MAIHSDIGHLARRGLGIDELRTEQREAIEAAIAGHDVLAVMPTGYGKSAIYQLVAASVDGPTVVVSPLIALQHDQIESLGDESLGDAVAANSSMKVTDRRSAFDGLHAGNVAFMFLAPEQLSRADTMQSLKQAEPSVFVVDEAHCISSWGHDFRPDYLRLGQVIDELGHPVVIALTATAAPPVQSEIAERLHLRNHKVVVHGFDRPNLHLKVEHPTDAREKDGMVLDRATVLSAGHRAGILYVGTRTRTEELADALRGRGVRAAAYHGGLQGRRRDDVHRRFMAGEVDVVVATTAFGMGIDKPDVRFVLHGDVPASLDSYYQEIGRAGRDGEEAEATLFYRAADLGLRRFLGAGGGVKSADVEEVAGALEEAGGTAHVDDLHEAVELSRRKVTLALTRLEDDAAVTVEGDEVRARVDDPGSAAEAIAVHEERRKQVETSRLEMMRTYAETLACRRRFLLSYFGERYDDNCGFCDTCESGAAAKRPAEAENAEFPQGSRVNHNDWGDGRVVRVEGDTVTVLFDELGYKNLSADLSTTGQLLKLID